MSKIFCQVHQKFLEVGDTSDVLELFEIREEVTVLKTDEIFMIIKHDLVAIYVHCSSH